MLNIRFLLPHLVLTAMLALAAPFAIAQEVVATDAETPVVETPALADDPLLSMGMPTQDEPQIKTPETAEIGELYLAGVFGDWEQRCVKAEDGSDPCRLYQLLKDVEGNPTAEISIFNLPDGGKAVAGAAILVPLDTLLSANLVFKVDVGREVLYPYTVCGLDGCIARVGFAAEQLAQMKNGKVASLTIVPAGAPDIKVAVAMSLVGFTAGFEAVRAANTKQ
jgi:invasion protein IalB